MFQTAWDAGVRFLDTAPMYGHGLSELRTGQSLRWKTRDDYVVASQVGRVLHPARRETISFAPWVNAAPLATVSPLIRAMRRTGRWAFRGASRTGFWCWR
jgi:D-threo-aldose 1-dehydrogenase